MSLGGPTVGLHVWVLLARSRSRKWIILVSVAAGTPYGELVLRLEIRWAGNCGLIVVSDSERGTRTRLMLRRS
jgi:hypothetical protein